MKKILLFFIAAFFSLSSFCQVLNLSINEIRGLDTTQGGCADYDSLIISTVGVVHGKNFGQANGRIQFSLIDNRADTLLNNRCGIGLFKANQNLPVTLNEGDSIRVFGLVTCFAGLSQIVMDSVVVLKNGALLNQPRVVSTLDEVSESYLVKLTNMEFISNTWQNAPTGAGFTAKAFNGVPGTVEYQEFDIRIDNDCDLYGQAMPMGKVDIIGLGGQFDSSIPRDSRYQLLPRSSFDIVPSAPQELPVISFQDTSYSFAEGSLYVINLKTNILTQSQISCLVECVNITTDSSDYILQQPPIATFPNGTTISTYGFTLLNDGQSESDEIFHLKLKSLDTNYTIGQDSVTKITIIGTTSVRNQKEFDFYKNALNGSILVKLRNNFNGYMFVYNSFGQLVMTSQDSQINSDLEKMKMKPFGIYRAIFLTDNKRFIKTFQN